jgi:PAS domain S-box-containing protein
MTEKAPAAGSMDIRAMLDWGISQSPVGVALVDREMRQLRLNPAMCRIFGLDSEATGLGLRLTDLIDTPGTEAVLEQARAVVRTGEPAVCRVIRSSVPGTSRSPR